MAGPPGRVAERLTPIAAVAAALGAFACCVPLGLMGAVAMFALSPFLDGIRPWFSTAAAVLLAVAALLTWSRRQTCRTGGARFGLLVLALAAVIVLAVLLFPQTVAGLFADYVL